MKIEWTDVSDRLPENVTPAIVYGECCDKCWHIKIAEIEDEEWFESGTGEDLNFTPTHWMDLPDPPKKKTLIEELQELRYHNVGNNQIKWLEEHNATRVLNALCVDYNGHECMVLNMCYLDTFITIMPHSVYANIGSVSGRGGALTVYLPNHVDYKKTSKQKSETMTSKEAKELKTKIENKLSELQELAKEAVENKIDFVINFKDGLGENNLMYPFHMKHINVTQFKLPID